MLLSFATSILFVHIAIFHFYKSSATAWGESIRLYFASLETERRVGKGSFGFIAAANATLSCSSCFFARVWLILYTEGQAEDYTMSSISCNDLVVSIEGDSSRRAPGCTKLFLTESGKVPVTRLLFEDPD